MARPKPETDAEGAHLYVQEIVLPTLAEFGANPTSRRHAFLACVVTFHTIDQMFPQSHAAMRKNYRDRSSDFALIDRVAHAFKHVRSDGLEPLLNRQVVPRPPAILGIMVLGVSILGDSTGAVEVVTEASVIELMPALERAVQFLGREIEALRA